MPEAFSVILELQSLSGRSWKYTCNHSCKYSHNVNGHLLKSQQQQSSQW